MAADHDPLIVLNLGCGREKAKLNIHTFNGSEPVDAPVRVYHLDMNPAVTPDLVCTLGQAAIPLPENTVDLAVAMHVLEHIGRQGETREWFFFWEDLYRVLKPGGRLQFAVPLASSVWAWADPTHVRALNEYAFLYFNQDAYRNGGSIPDYRVRCDFVPLGYERGADEINADVRAQETHSYLSGTLLARKPLNPWWMDHGMA